MIASDTAHVEREQRSIELSEENRLLRERVETLEKELVSVTAARRVEVPGSEGVDTAHRLATEQPDHIFSTLFQAIPVGITLSSVPETIFLAVNDTFVRETGFAREEIIGLAAQDSPLIDDPGDMQGIIMELHNKGIVHGAQITFRKKNGTRVACLMSVSMVVLDGRPCALSTILDISDRARDLDALRASEEKFRTLTSHMSEGLMRVDADDVILFVNPRLCEMLGYEESELLGKVSYKTVLFKEDWDLIMQKNQERAQGKIDRYRTRIRRKNGDELLVEISGSPVGPTCDLPAGSIGLISDITERMHMEQATRESERLYRLLAEHAQDVIWTATLDGRWKYISPSVWKMRGYTPEQAGNTDLKDMMPASSYEKVTRKFAELWDCVREGREWQPEVLQLELLRKDGSSFWSESLLSLLQNEDGGAPLLLGVTRDISVRKQVEHELLIAKERAEKSERLKDAFVANISHEIRTPLNIILGYSNVIGEKFLPYAAPGDQRFFESVQRGGERLQRTVDMILNMSRLQAGEFIVKPVDLDIAALVRKITADHQPLAQSKSLRLSYIDACGSAVVRADEYCVSQAISNLLHNAIKFTINGEVCLRVFRNAQGSVCVSCQDTGIGISPEYLPQLFARYSQEEVGYSRPFEGLGLGMALIAEYLMLSHATITVESAKGVGSTFTITFPPTETSTALTQETAPDSGVQLSQTASGPALHVWKRRTVLVVEDDEMTVEYMNIILEDQYDVYAADGVDAAWTLLHAKQIDIILMDISLAGGQTGLDLTREIRNSPLHSDIPIIAVTAHAYDADRRRSLDAGCDDYLRKPISSAALFKSMERLLRH